MDEIETRYDLPDILPEQQEAWERAKGRRFGPRMLAALQRIAGGDSPKSAALAEGYSDGSHVYNNAKTVGLVDLTTKTIIGTHRSIVTLAGAALERALIEGNVKVSPSQLAVIMGISTDKVLKSEERSKDDGTTYLSALERMAQQIADSGATLELTVSVKPAEPIPVVLEPETPQLPDNITSSGYTDE